MISFIIPAHNEERWIGTCVNSIHVSMRELAVPYEVIVVNDASTDATPHIAAQAGARVVEVALRKISAVRNAGAREASGDIFFFVDADTQINEPAVSAGLAALRSGAAGGGCVFEFDGRIPLWSRMAHRAATLVARIIRWVGGCFIFCTREAYAATGGFSEQLYAGEDIAFVQALKRVGPFAVPKPTVITSGRKIAVVSPWDVAVLIATIALCGPNYDSPIIRDILYGRRAQQSKDRTEAV